MLPIHTILHPSDFSKHSDYALRIAGSIVRYRGARLIVAHVLDAAEPPVWLYDRMEWSFPCAENCNDVMDQTLRPLQEFGPGLRVERRVVEGIPAEEILRLAEAEKCDLIVMGTQGRTGLERILMGSVAEAVLRRAHCPVLTVKDPTVTPPSGPSTKDLERTSPADSA